MGRRRHRRRFENADILLLHLFAHIHRLGESQRFVVSGLEPLQILADLFVISHFAAGLDGFGIPFLERGFQILDLQLDGLTPMSQLFQRFVPRDLNQFLLSRDLFV